VAKDCFAGIELDAAIRGIIERPLASTILRVHFGRISNSDDLNGAEIEEGRKPRGAGGSRPRSGCRRSSQIAWSAIGFFAFFDGLALLLLPRPREEAAIASCVRPLHAL
jgi:hypothetical protein